MEILLFISILANIILLFILLFGCKKAQTAMVAENKSNGSGKENKGVKEACEKNIMDTSAGLNELKTLINGAEDNKKCFEQCLHKIAADTQAVQGALYLLHNTAATATTLRFYCGYAFYCPDNKPLEFEMGEGLIGQVAKDQKTLNLNTVPFEHTPAISGLGKTVAQYLIICPLVKNDATIGVMEFSAFKPFDAHAEKYIESAAEMMAGCAI